MIEDNDRRNGPIQFWRIEGNLYTKYQRFPRKTGVQSPTSTPLYRNWLVCISLATCDSEVRSESAGRDDKRETTVSGTGNRKQPRTGETYLHRGEVGRQAEDRLPRSRGPERSIPEWGEKNDLCLLSHLSKCPFLMWSHLFLSPPVLMHGGILCVAFRLSVCD